MIARSKQYIADAKMRLAMPDRFRPLRDILDSLSAWEINMVGRICGPTRHRQVARMAATISWLGNGLIYALIGLPILLLVPGSARAVLAGSVALLIAHLIYPWLKLACARERPYTANSELQPLIKTLDRLSFPSGHVMSLSAACMPLLLVFPAFWPAAGGLWLAMGWSRIACAHHYPSDVLAGTAIGAGIAMPLSWSML